MILSCNGIPMCNSNKNNRKYHPALGSNKIKFNKTGNEEQCAGNGEYGMCSDTIHKEALCIMYSICSISIVNCIKSVYVRSLKLRSVYVWGMWRYSLCVCVHLCLCYRFYVCITVLVVGRSPGFGEWLWRPQLWGKSCLSDYLYVI